MALILNIDTATETALISLAENETVLCFAINNNQKDHASFLHPAIQDLLNKTGKTINKIDAVAVTSGPGSYTGIRVGMATAKGLCYALQKPLITINTLEVIALSSILKNNENALYCAMIDARRMEVFTAVYDKDLNEIIVPQSMILQPDTFRELLKTNKIYFSGSGAVKMNAVVGNENVFIMNDEITAESMANLSFQHYKSGRFSDISYSSPVYLKEFYTIKSNP